MIPERFKVGYAWSKDRLHGGGTHVSASEMLRFLTQGSAARRSLKYITKIQEEGDFLAISLEGNQGIIYWPKQEPLGMISQVVDEQMQPSNGHRYLTAETPLAADDIAIDCGASEGLFSFLNYRTCRRVIAVEPNSLYLQALKKTFKDNEKVTIAPVAVGSYSGTAHFNNHSVCSSVRAEGRVEVTMRRLDDLLKELGSSASYIKADLEGFEMNFLEGAKETISSYKPKIAITTYHDRDHPRQIADFLRHINPAYRIRLKGYSLRSGAIMLHAWV